MAIDLFIGRHDGQTLFLGLRGEMNSNDSSVCRIEPALDPTVTLDPLEKPCRRGPVQGYFVCKLARQQSILFIKCDQHEELPVREPYRGQAVLVSPGDLPTESTELKTNAILEKP